MLYFLCLMLKESAGKYGASQRIILTAQSVLSGCAFYLHFLLLFLSFQKTELITSFVSMSSNFTYKIKVVVHVMILKKLLLQVCSHHSSLIRLSIFTLMTYAMLFQRWRKISPNFSQACWAHSWKIGALARLVNYTENLLTCIFSVTFNF